MYSILTGICTAVVFANSLLVHGSVAEPYRRIDPGKELFLTPLIHEGKLTLARNLSRVDVLPGENVESYSGYLTVDVKTNSNLFFWFVPALENPKTAPIFLWLQGGPGSSSLLGLFLEHGPYVVESDMRIKLRNTTWTRKFSIIYVDNPVGTGFSFTDAEEGYSTTISDVAENLFEALQQFFTLFPEYSSNYFYVAGESMAGKFVPATAHTIHRNKNIANMKLTGIVIGDGLCDPETMMDYGDFLRAMGLIDDRQANYFKEKEQEIRDAMANNDTLRAYFLWAELIDSDKVKAPVTYFNRVTGFENKFNLLYSKDPSVPRLFNKFLRLPEVRRAIHVGNRRYGGGGVVHQHLRKAIMTSAKPWIAELIEHYKVLIFDGQLDLLVPYTLTKKFVDSIEWSGQKELANCQRVIWRELRTGFPAGYVRKVKKFTEVLVRNAGHLVPYDQPENAYDMVDRYINDKPFN